MLADGSTPEKNCPMRLLADLSSFIKKYTDKIPSYKDGFFEVPFISNSPEGMVESLGKLFGHKIDRKRQVISSRTPFADGTLHYFQLEEGCWIIAVDVLFKKNMRYKKVYLKKAHSDFYTFSYSKFVHALPRIPSFNRNLLYSSNYFILTRPGETIEACYGKGTHGKYINVMATRDWMIRNSEKQLFGSGEMLKDFMENDRPYISWPELKGDTYNFHKKIWSLLVKGPNQTGFFDHLRRSVYEMLNELHESMKNQDPLLLNSDLRGDDRVKTLKAEQMLMKNLYGSFPGVEELADHAGMASTKLKICFRQIYGKTMFDYYRKNKMEAATVMIRSGGYLISDVAHRMGYNNTSKFIAAFKEEVGMLPSEVKPG